MEFVDLKNKSTAELVELLREKKEELRTLRFKASEHQLKQVHLIKNVKHQIAQICFVLQSVQAK